MLESPPTKSRINNLAFSGISVKPGQHHTDDLAISILIREWLVTFSATSAKCLPVQKKKKKKKIIRIRKN
jgi:hypothetical protein